MPKRKRGFTRRNFIRTTGSAAIAGPAVLSACGKDEVTGPETRTLKIMQQGHFVPGYDTWFDEFAMNWGESNGVDVTVEHVSRPDLIQLTIDEIAAGEGHDLIEHITPPAQFEPDVHDLREVNEEAERRFGAQLEFQKRTVLNSKTGKYYGFAPGWAPNNGDYRRSLWEAEGLPDGPTSYDDLMTVGAAIKENAGVPIALGMSDELDAGTYLPGILLAFGASVQDADHNVVINSPESIAAVQFISQLYASAQAGGGNPDPFGTNWTSGTNNQLFNGGTASFIINPISHYRSAQKDSSLRAIADDNFMTKALMGPAGVALVPSNISFVYIVPSFSPNLDSASEFMLALTESYGDAITQTELYNHPSYPNSAPNQMSQLINDPFGSTPANKLEVLADAATWNTNVGHPGSDNPALGEVVFSFIIPRMFANTAMGGMTAEQSVADAEMQINAIYTMWRDRGLV